MIYVQKALFHANTQLLKPVSDLWNNDIIFPFLKSENHEYKRRGYLKYNYNNHGSDVIIINELL